VVGGWWRLEGGKNLNVAFGEGGRLALVFAGGWPLPWRFPSFSAFIEGGLLLFLRLLLLVPHFGPSQFPHSFIHLWKNGHKLCAKNWKMGKSIAGRKKNLWVINKGQF
jgi:hypothetical protein